MLNDMTSFWKRVQDAIYSAMSRMITEEEVIATRPGAITVRPFVAPGSPDPGSQELRSLSAVSARPGDRVVVLRHPTIKAVLGKLTIRGVGEPAPTVMQPAILDFHYANSTLVTFSTSALRWHAYGFIDDLDPSVIYRLHVVAWGTFDANGTGGGEARMGVNINNAYDGPVYQFTTNGYETSHPVFTKTGTITGISFMDVAVESQWVSGTVRHRESRIMILLIPVA